LSFVFDDLWLLGCGFPISMHGCHVCIGGSGVSHPLVPSTVVGVIVMACDVIIVVIAPYRLPPAAPVEGCPSWEAW
jgi:hypothetical protein